MSAGQSGEDETLQNELEAMAIWESHLERAADQWKQGVTQSQDDYRRGLARFLGVNESEISQEVSHDWNEAVTQMSPDEFRQSIQGEGADWLVGLYEGVTGRQAPERIRQAAQRVEEQTLQRTSEQPSGQELVSAMREEIRSQAHQTQSQGGSQQQTQQGQGQQSY